jgi:hypothetical protein
MEAALDGTNMHKQLTLRLNLGPDSLLQTLVNGYAPNAHHA